MVKMRTSALSLYKAISNVGSLRSNMKIGYAVTGLSTGLVVMQLKTMIDLIKYGWVIYV